MENEQLYRSTIKSRPYFYFETKKLAVLVLQGLNELQIKERVIGENIFQVKTEIRKKEIASIILKRIKELDEYLLERMITSDTETSKIIVLYAILKTDRLFYEFMHDVFSDKLLFPESALTDHSMHSFFENKRQQSKTVAAWSEYTFYKLRQVYIRILFESGLLKNKNTRKITIPIVNPEVIDHMRQIGDHAYINAIIGGPVS